MGELKSRILTGVLFGIVMISVNWLPIYIVIPFFGFISCLTASEFVNLVNNVREVNLDKSYSIISVGIFYFFMTVSKVLNVEANMYYALVPMFFILILFELWRNVENALLNITNYGFLLVFCVVPFYFMTDLVYISQEKELKYPILLSVLCIIWINDTMAYFTGKRFGKNLIFKRISPKKTWEGTIGGIVFSLAGAITLAVLNSNFTMLFWIVSAFIIIPSSILGDFFESMLKRAVNKKDSGNILPGHGGILDRFDSLIFSIPIFYFWFVLYLNYFK